jgi:hypothetical protein
MQDFEESTAYFNYIRQVSWDVTVLHQQGSNVDNYFEDRKYLI